MSYILDALKRADAQRERGQVPGLNAQPLVVAPARTDGHRLRWWMGLACGGLALAGGLLYWRMDSTQAAAMPGPVIAQTVTGGQPVLPSVQTAPTTPSAPSPPPAPVSAQPPSRDAKPAATPAPKPGVRQAPPQAAPAAQAPATTAQPAAQPAAKSATTPPAPPATKTAPATRPPQSPASATAATALPVLADLPEDLRRTVPKLAVSGTVYSSNPSQRILIVNGQVLNEGASLAPDLVLETIGARSAVLNLRGTRFRLDY